MQVFQRSAFLMFWSHSICCCKASLKGSDQVVAMNYEWVKMSMSVASHIKLQPLNQRLTDEPPGLLLPAINLTGYRMDGILM